MTNFSVDFDSLGKSLEKVATKSHKLEDVKDRIEKVAFDVVRFRDDDGNTNLWTVQDSEEGKVIVALYDSDASSDQTKSGSDWEAIPDKQANIHVYHKGEPLGRFACSKLGIDSDEVNTACRWLPEKLADDSFREKLFKYVGLSGGFNG